MTAAFAAESELACEGDIEEDNRIDAQRAVLGRSEAHDIDAGLPRQRGRRAADERKRISEACAIHVELQSMAVRCGGDSPNLFRSVNRTALSGLRDRRPCGP